MIGLWDLLIISKRTGCSRGCPMSCIAYELTADDELIRQDINSGL